jgi:hypothetical protein
MERQLRPEAACLFPVPAPYESKLSTGPKPKTAGCFRNQLPFHCLAERAIEPNTLYAPLYNARRLILNAESSRKYYLIIAGNGVTLG